ncbi:MAG TPA: hypothetical protein VJH68_04730 [Candidatus Nanoarchaeia archaeon]|nr:hypothetical protein [Candidatus Nanoarchaeia archaeon]
MPFLNFIEKAVSAQGLDLHNKVISSNLYHHLLDEELNYLKQLNSIPKIALDTNYPILLYPGSGSDILYPLFFLGIIDNLQQATLIFIDIQNNLGMIKSILDDVGISFAEDNNTIAFYWKKILIRLEFRLNSFFSMELPRFDIYFERKFAIFREALENYELKIVEALNKKGLIISDYGFKNFKFEQMTVPAGLSSYSEMILGRKIT